MNHKGFAQGTLKLLRAAIRPHGLIESAAALRPAALTRSSFGQNGPEVRLAKMLSGPPHPDASRAASPSEPAELSK